MRCKLTASRFSCYNALFVKNTCAQQLKNTCLVGLLHVFHHRWLTFGTILTNLKIFCLTDRTETDDVIINIWQRLAERERESVLLRRKYRISIWWNDAGLTDWRWCSFYLKLNMQSNGWHMHAFALKKCNVKCIYWIHTGPVHLQTRSE